MLISRSIYERIISPAALAFFLLYLLGLFFPIRAAQGAGLAGVVIMALVAAPGASLERRDIWWIAACGVMLVAGWWGMKVAPDGDESWRHFWSYQAIGKGTVCALALLILPFSTHQIRWLLIFLLVMLAARNVQFLAYGYENSGVLVGAATSQAQLLGFRNQGDHIVLLSPFVLAVALSWQRWFLPVAIAIAIEASLLALTGWRGAWLGLFGGCLFLLFYFRAWKAVGFLFLLAALIGAIGLLAVDSNIVGMAIKRGAGDSLRIDMVWRPVLDLLAASDWQGYGFGSARFMEVFASYVAAHPEKGIPLFPDAHNVALAFAMAAGWLGFIAFIVMLITAVILCARYQRERCSPEHLALLSGTVASWVGVYGLLGLTDQPFYNNFAVLCALTSAVLVGERRRVE